MESRFAAPGVPGRFDPKLFNVRPEFFVKFLQQITEGLHPLPDFWTFVREGSEVAFAVEHCYFPRDSQPAV